MMELGATVCLRQNPQCLVCPVAGFCAARESGQPNQFPKLKPKQIEQREVARVWCVDRGRLLLHRSHAKAKRLAGLYELPEASVLGEIPIEKSLLLRKRRAITRYQITESIYRVKPAPSQRKRIASETSLEWIPLGKLSHLTLSGPHKRWIGELLKTTSRG